MKNEDIRLFFTFHSSLFTLHCHNAELTLARLEQNDLPHPGAEPNAVLCSANPGRRPRSARDRRGRRAPGPAHRLRALPRERPPEQITTAPAPESRDVIARDASPMTPPGKFHTRCGYYVFYHDFDLDKNDPLFAELESLPDQVFGELKLPPSNSMVQVFLFESENRYKQFMHARFKDLPSRRAYFIQEIGSKGSMDDLKIYTWMDPW